MVQSSTNSASDTDSAGGASNGIHPDLLEKWGRTRLAHEAVMLQDAQDLLTQQRKAVAAHHQNNGLTGADDDVGNIIVGDTTINHAPPQQKPGLSGLAKAGIVAAAAAALGGGVGLPLALPSIINALKPAAAQPSVDTDTDTMFDLFIGAPKNGTTN